MIEIESLEKGKKKGKKKSKKNSSGKQKNGAAIILQPQLEVENRSSKVVYTDLGERGRLSNNNKLNDMTGKEWIKFTKSWFIHRPKRRNEVETLHPAKYPESLVQEFIEFFSKKGQWIFEPFSGTGSTIVAAQNCNRNSVGIEITKKYAEIANRRVAANNALNFENVIADIIVGNSVDAYEIVKNKYPAVVERGFDFCITSPPYWNQLKRNSMRQAKRKLDGLDTVYSLDKHDIGNEDDYHQFLSLQKTIFNNVFKLLKNKAYLCVITNNIYTDSRLYPLAFDTFNSLTSGECAFVGKDEKIWLQDDKALANLGINNAYVGNRHHQYCLIFRKEIS